jgi:acyl-coenzyme A thioesterase PaaI-like protein
VITTIADHSSAGAASTIIGADEYVVTLEYKINLLRAAGGDRLRCRSQVLRSSGSFSVVESEIYSMTQDKATLSAKGLFTLAVLKK